jgi:hypothetical protein
MFKQGIIGLCVIMGIEYSIIARGQKGECLVHKVSQ